MFLLTWGMGCDPGRSSQVSGFDFFGPSRLEAFLRVNLQAKGDQIVLTTSLEEIEAR